MAFAQQHNFRNYNVEDGVGQSQVYALYQDQMGIIWMGTRGGGISLFDGFDFKSYTEQDGLSNNYINDIKASNDSTIWIGTNTGLDVYNGKEFKSIDLGSIQKAVIRDICVTDKSEIYFASNKGIFKVENGKAKALYQTNIEELKNTTSVLVEEDGVIWIGTNKGLFRFENGDIKAMADESSYMGNAITTITRDSKNYLWIGTYGDGMYCYNRKMFYRIDLHHELYRETVLDIHIDQQENLWMATLRGGIVQYDRSSKTFSTIQENEGLANNHVRCILEDANGNHWFGTSGGGASHYLGKQFTTFDERSGLAGNFIYSIFRDSKDRLWIGNSQRGVSVDSNGIFINYHGANGFANVKVKSIAEDNNGDIWLGTDGRGVFVFKEGEFIEIEELKRAYVKQIKSDKNGTIWIATAGSGLIKITPSQENYLIEKWGANNGVLSNRLTSLHFDKRGRLWYGTESAGVGCFDKKSRTTIVVNQDNFLSSNLVRCLSEDSNGNLWIGTASKGICAYGLYQKRGRKMLNTDKGLTSNNIYLISCDSEGTVIVGSEKGLDRVILNKDGSLKQIKHYGKLDGFSGVETCQNSVWNDKDGTIWFGTVNGMCRFNPKELQSNSHSPILGFKDIKLEYQSILDRGSVLQFGQQVAPLHLSFDQNHITFEFLGVNMKRPQNVLYRWKLVGFDRDWSPPSKERNIMYSNLNPGKYRFLLIASNEDGVWTETPLEYSFEIETPYWQTAWFRAMIALGASLLVIGIFLLIYFRLKRKVKAKQKELTLQKEFLELEQKAMRLQMNPHFIFNALNSIQSMIGTGQETEARYYLAKFSRLMRQILDNSRQSSITLEEEVNSLENYLLIEQFCNANAFDYSIELDQNLESDFINIPPMIVQPFVENSIKYGMKGKTEGENKGQIVIQFSEENSHLICTITDNGIGRQKAEELKQQSKETYHRSSGMEVTTERLNMNRRDEIEPLEIIDLYENGIAKGTQVIIRLPID